MRAVLAVIVYFALAASASADTLITSGVWAHGPNWSTGHMPTVEEEAVIPVGKEARVEHAVTTGPLKDYGLVSGSATLNVVGAVHLAPGSFPFSGTLDLKGLGTITAETLVNYIRIDGNDTLADPLDAGTLVAYEGSTLATDGYPVTVTGETYPYGEADWLLGSSIYTTGYWLVFPVEDGGEIHAEDATIIIDGDGGQFGGVFKGEHWSYGAVTFDSPTGDSRGDYTVGTLGFDEPTTLEGDRTITASSLTTTGTVEHPVRVSSSGAVIDCACEVPAGLELAGVTVEP